MSEHRAQMHCAGPPPTPVEANPASHAPRAGSVAELAALDRPWYLRSRRIHTLARKAVLATLERLADGRLRVVDETEAKARIATFGHAAADRLEATVRVRDPRFYVRVALRGALGAGESYVAGEWHAGDSERDGDQLAAVMRLMVRNRRALDALDEGWARLFRPLLRLYHRARANSRRGSRRNIGAHYDLGNEFFATFLDPTLMYSSAIFEHPDATLEEASTAKLDRLCQLLALGPDDHLLEIGTGWGGLALHAARTGCRVTTTTISPAQHAHARERVRAAGLDHRVAVLDRDYRELDGRFDKLVSVEMVEAVGERYLDGFFRVAAARLAPGGRMALQAITIAEPYYRQALASVDFIQRYIFPGSFIPSVSRLTAAAAAAGLTAVHLDDIGKHYAETLLRWRRRFEANLDAIREQGFSERFLRLWRYYFCYCEGGFREGAISDVQMVFVKPGAP